MKELVPMDKYGVFADSYDTPRVDSRFVAVAFEKNHRDVLRSIRTLADDASGLSNEFRLRNFALST